MTWILNTLLIAGTAFLLLFGEPIATRIQARNARRAAGRLIRNQNLGDL